MLVLLAPPPPPRPAPEARETVLDKLEREKALGLRAERAVAADAEQGGGNDCPAGDCCGAATALGLPICADKSDEPTPAAAADDPAAAAEAPAPAPPSAALATALPGMFCPQRSLAEVAKMHAADATFYEVRSALLKPNAVRRRDRAASEPPHHRSRGVLVTNRVMPRRVTTSPRAATSYHHHPLTAVRARARSRFAPPPRVCCGLREHAGGA